MKLGITAIAEIMALVADGIAYGKDISEGIRAIDLGPRNGWDKVTEGHDVLELTQQYVDVHPRAAEWDDTEAN